MAGYRRVTVSELSQLSPQPLWDIFAQICAIAHPSHHEEALASHIMQWAQQHAIAAERDKVGNILLRKAATPGMETRKTVVLQAHLDMVPQKNNDTVHDFAKDPIRPYIDNGWVKARGTTLGADNGIGMASALALLIDPQAEHGPLEVLLTMTEESGMDGAMGLQPDWLQADILINTDSETEGEIYMGCAGGIDFITTLPLQRDTLAAGYSTFLLSLKGLKGGHSGAEIHLGLGNANKLLARFLATQTADLTLRLIEFSGGTLRNAIPREAQALVAVPAAEVELLTQRCQQFLTTLQSELSAVEHNIQLSLSPATPPLAPLTQACQQRFIALLQSTPNGVMRMSDDIKGIVETSLNVGVVTSEEHQAQIICLIRSLVDSAKDDVVGVLSALGQLAGAHTTPKGGYPGWKPDMDSPIMAQVGKTYQRLFNQTPNIMVIHAGLECGLFKKPYPQLDMVSIGPTITGPHSPDEQVNIASVGRYWQLLTALLKDIAQRD